LISNRFNTIGNLLETNPLFETKISLEKEGEVILDLTNSNPTSVGLEFPDTALRHILESTNLSHYKPYANGNPNVREFISEWYSKRSVKFSANDVFLTPSTSDAYSYLFKLLTNPGDEILTPSPGYPLFSFLAKLDNLKEVHYPLQQNGDQFVYDAETLYNHISTNTKLIVLVSPSNPSGSRTTQKFWEAWKEFGCKIPIILDEVFYGYEWENQKEINTHILPSKIDAPIFVLNGISKMFALPQWKLGWILLAGNASESSEIKNTLETIIDTYLSTNSIIQSMLPQIFPWMPMVQNKINSRIQRNFRYISDSLYDFPDVQITSESAGWFLVLKIQGDSSSEDFCESILKSKQVFLFPGSWFGYSHDENYVILSLIIEESILEEAINRIQAFLK
jgi:aspartate/methionine/tyrosine aminotransferase